MIWCEQFFFSICLFYFVFIFLLLFYFPSCNTKKIYILYSIIWYRLLIFPPRVFPSIPLGVVTLGDPFIFLKKNSQLLYSLENKFFFFFISSSYIFIVILDMDVIFVCVYIGCLFQESFILNFYVLIFF